MKFTCLTYKPSEMTRFNAIILTVFTLLAWSCNDSQQQEVELSAPAPWVGYWDFQNYPGPNERAYLRVPDDNGFEVTEKNQMLEFREDGFVREFFWNRCATEPVIPTGWKDGTWTQSGSDPVVLQLTIEGQPRAYEILALDDTSLVVRSIQ